MPNWLAGAEKLLKARGGKWFAGDQVNLWGTGAANGSLWTRQTLRPEACKNSRNTILKEKILFSKTQLQEFHDTFRL